MKKAFTLAETLITLAIIGVIAAVTIPSVLHHHRKTVIQDRLLKFYQQVNEAIRLSEIENGSQLTWDTLQTGFETDEDGNNDYTQPPKSYDWYNTYLAPYLNTIKVDYETSGTEGYTLVYFTDGSLMMLAKNSTVFYPYAGDYENGSLYFGEVDSKVPGTSSTRDRSQSGIKYFLFSFSNRESSAIRGQGFVPYGSTTADREKLLTDSSIGCQQTVSNERAYCTRLIQLNGWKIPDDYFYKF